MSAHMLEGKVLAKRLQAELQAKVAGFAADHGRHITLAVLQVGEDAGAAGYARAIQRSCTGVGISFHKDLLPAASDQCQVEASLDTLNRDARIHGIMILEPLPATIDAGRLVLGLHPGKDVDGVHPLNAGRLFAQHPPYYVPATPLGAIRLLEDADIPFQGRRAVMVGRSNIVGKPMAMLLLQRHSTVTMAHSRTVDLPGLCREADILCLAVGRPELVTGAWVKPGAVVVDFGTTYTDQGLKGDCDQASVAGVAGAMTPVPGGVGPMTNITLLHNVVTAAQRSVGESAPG